MRCAVLLWLLAAIFPLSGPARADATPEPQQVSAAIVYNIARFAEWPAGRFAADPAVLVLCTLEGEQATPALQAFSGRPVGERVLRVRVVAQASAMTQGCHVAFLTGPPARAAPQLDELARARVLVVGEGEAMAAHGAVALVRVGRQIRFQVNQSVAQTAGVTFSSRLLRLAVTVR